LAVLLVAFGSLATPTARAAGRSGVQSVVAPVASGLTDRIAYSDDGGIWTMDADGAHRTRLTDTPESDFDPSWSSDGTRLVFRASRGVYGPDPAGLGAEGIYVVNADGTGERQLWPPDAQAPGGLFPDWGPDGRIAFSGYGSDGIVETTSLVNPDGTGLVDLRAPGEGPIWSPDGSKIMYGRHPGTGDRQVWVMDADGSHQTRLTALPGGQYPDAWLPDGRIVYADWSRGGATPDWFVMNADGSGVAPLPGQAGLNEPTDWLPANE
jgi:Tol biopolymer transport system component